MLDTLSTVYEAFLDANPHVPKLSADEALLVLGDYPQEKRWLIAFIALWEESSRFGPRE